MSDHGFRDALEAAFDESAAAEEESPVSEEVEATESVTSDDEQTLAQEDDDVEQEASATDSQEADELEQDGQAEFDWNDVPESAWNQLERTPRDQTPIRYMRLKQDRDRFASEVDHLRRQLDEVRQGLPREPEPAKEEAPASEPPKPPSDDADDKEWREYYSTRDQWLVEEAQRRALETVTKTQQEREEQQRREMAQQKLQDQRAELLEHAQSKEGMTDDIAAVMVELARSKPWYEVMLDSKDGIDELFDTARRRLDGQRKVAQETTRKATAKDRATPRPTPTPKKASGDMELPENARGMDAIGSIVDGFGG